MTRPGQALFFASSDSADRGLIVQSLARIGITPIQPAELSDRHGDVAIIVIERPGAPAVKICTNLRNQEGFQHTPILVLLDEPDRATIAHLSDYLRADVFIKPISPVAIQRYLNSKIQAFANSNQEEVLKAVMAVGQNSIDASNRPSTDHSNGESGAATATAMQPVASAAIEDQIPESNSLLPIRSAVVPRVKGGILCAQCQRWKVRREDAFCARCGTRLSVLEIPSEAIVFEPLGQHRIGRLIDVRNAGQNPLCLVFSVSANSHLAKRFSLHTEQSVLDGGGKAYLRLHFDATGLDLTSNYQASLEIVSNEAGITKRSLPIVIERLANPKVSGSDLFTYVLGAENCWAFYVGNEGGGTISLTRVRYVDAENDIELRLINPVSVGGNATSPATVLLPALDLATGRRDALMVCSFAHHPDVILSANVEVIRPARLTVQPLELHFGPTSAQRSRRLALTLVNSGGEELTVQAVQSSAEWLECLVQCPLHIAPGGAQIIDVQVNAGGETVDNHNAEILIQTNSYEAGTLAVPCSVLFINPADYEECIGVDFGTTASCVAILNNDRQPVVIMLEQASADGRAESSIMPSVLFFHPDGSISAGREAQELAMIQPANAVTSIKRVLGRHQEHNIAGKNHGPTELTAKIIEQLTKRTEDGLFRRGEYKTPRRAVVTVPIEFYDNQRRALLDACRLAGLDMESSSKHGVIIDEAQAAALYYLNKRTGEDIYTGPELILIFDFGGGTLDCALIEIDTDFGDDSEITKTRFTTLAVQGDPRLGGEDIDWALVQLLAKRAREQYPAFDLTCVGDERQIARKIHKPEIIEAAYLTRSRFKRQAEMAKIRLTEARSAEVMISPLLGDKATPHNPYLENGNGPAHFETTLTREDLESILKEFLDRATRVVSTLCHRAGRKPKDVQTILHVGRTSFLPMVRERINSMLPGAIDRSDLVEPKLCVALGAAFWGYIKDRPAANFEFEGVSDRTANDLGYLDLNGIREVFHTVIPAQTEFPCEVIVEIKSAGNWIDLRLAENHGRREVVRDNPEIRHIGNVRIDAHEIGVGRLPVKFAINQNRVLEITANGKTQVIEPNEE